MPWCTKLKLESRLLGEISVIFRYAGDTTLMAESEEELKSFLRKVKEENWKAAFKLNIQNTKIMEFSPKYMGEKWKQWEILFSWVPKSLQMVTATMKLKYTCSLEEKLWQS